MALNRTNGVFSPTMFHPTVYDTGRGKSKSLREEEEDLRKHLLKEDEEILPIILAISSNTFDTPRNLYGNWQQRIFFSAFHTLPRTIRAK